MLTSLAGVTGEMESTCHHEVAVLSAHGATAVRLWTHEVGYEVEGGVDATGVYLRTALLIMIKHVFCQCDCHPAYQFTTNLIVINTLTVNPIPTLTLVLEAELYASSLFFLEASLRQDIMHVKQNAWSHPAEQ